MAIAQRLTPRARGAEGGVGGCGGSGGSRFPHFLESVTDEESSDKFLRIDQKQIHYIHQIHQLVGKRPAAHRIILVHHDANWYTTTPKTASTSCYDQCRVGFAVGIERSVWRRAHVHDNTASWISRSLILVSSRTLPRAWAMSSTVAGLVGSLATT